MTDRVVVTGLGVMAPNGFTASDFWAAACEGRSGISRIERFDTSGFIASLAGQILDVDLAQNIPKKLLPQTDRSTRLALVAAAAALDDAGFDPATTPVEGVGVITSSAAGGLDYIRQQFSRHRTQGPRAVSAYSSFAWFYAVNTGQISIRHGLRGPGHALVAEQAGGLDAVGHGRRTVRLGNSLVVCGGSDSSLDPWGWAAHLSDGRVSTCNDPQRAFLPFDRLARGHVPGEGGAYLVLEDATAARARKAPAYGEIAGYAATFDPAPGLARPPGLRRAIELALADAGAEPADVGAVFADGAGATGPDAEEAAAIAGVFGRYGVPVTVPKALTGRLLAGGGPLDVVAALFAVRDGVIPHTAHTNDVPEAYGIDLVRDAPRTAPLTTALVLARGKGGFNTAVVIRKP